MQDEHHNRNFIMAMLLSFVALLLWNMFIGFPTFLQPSSEQERLAQEQQIQADPNASTAPRPEAGSAATGAPAPAVTSKALLPRGEVIAKSPRVPIKTSSLHGSISLKGARIDDLVLSKYTNDIVPDSGQVVLFSPSGAENAYYAEHGWSPDPGIKLKLPGKQTLWSAQGTPTLTPLSPVTLTWDNGEGLLFKRVISVDDNFMFTVRQEVTNNLSQAIRLHPYALISRHGAPEVTSFLILHEGFIGIFGEHNLKEVDYDQDELAGRAAKDEVETTYKDIEGGWLGITDKYWAAVVIPDQKATHTSQYSVISGPGVDRYQADYLRQAVPIQAGATTAIEGRLFAGAKEVALVDGYDEALEIDRFELLIDWGWLYFLTKPLFYAIDFCYQLVGNFGLAIILVTIVIKLILFPLANKSYVSMSRMKKLQPEMERLKKRHDDDMVRQQQAMAELYKKEKLNPLAGCWPVLIQIPVFFALYKVLFVTIEMRQAPFYGWIKDLSVADPTTFWNLFGLLPFDPSWIVPGFLMVGAWPIMMGLIMFVQMRLNPTPTDPTQAMMFTWMPVVFTFILANFPAGLVIYWTWNNLLSVIQQGYIMSSQGVEIALWKNLGLKAKKADERSKT